MAGIHEPNVIDLVTHHAERGEFALIMIEDRPWSDSSEQLAELREKINSYAMFVLDEGMLRIYPESAGQSLRIQLDCQGPPSPQAQELIGLATERLLDYGVRFVVNVLG